MISIARKKSMFKSFVKVGCFFALSFVTACGLETYQSGDLPTKARLNAVREGKTREDVVRLLGQPAYQASAVDGVQDGSFFVYAKIRKESRAFFDPKETDREIYVITFNRQNVVTGVQRLTAADGKNVPYDATETKTGGRELSTLEQIAKNFGRYDAGGRDSTAR